MFKLFLKESGNHKANTTSNIILKQNNKMVLTSKHSSSKLTAISNMSNAELDNELIKSIESGKTYTAEEIDEILSGKFGI